MTHLCFRCLTAYADDIEQIAGGCGMCSGVLFLKIRSPRVARLRPHLERAGFAEKSDVQDAIEDALGANIDAEGIAVLDVDTFEASMDGYRVLVVQRLTNGGFRRAVIGPVSSLALFAGVLEK